ncbi:MAG: tyrosine--tRNA ligase [Candidatus Magasanikbacteria bacterium]|nr:tyrosine--tRNA ligase [Candidatus Magasanikbacteria bacterium]
MTTQTDPKKIQELLNRGVDEVIVKADLEKKLLSGKKLRVKLGIDPTSPNLHIGRSIPLLKMRDFQELGHQLVFIVGDATGVIGDTSDKDSERPMLTHEQVKKNMKAYVEQAGKIIDIKKCEVRYNSEWHNKLSSGELEWQADQFSLHDFIMRENIKKRLNVGTRVSLREAMYPLMQGYDSVAVKADVEIGGTDQRFNLLAGRTMQPAYKQVSQNIVMGPLLEGTDGRKMSSSWGNTINFNDTPEDMYGKCMTVPDDVIIKYFTLATRVPLTMINEYAHALKQGANPRDIKMKLAYELTSFYHNEKIAGQAEHNFVAMFRNKAKPDDIPNLKPSRYDLVTTLVEAKIVSSKSEARRAIEQKGVKVNDQVVADSDLKLKPGDIIQKGKRFFVKII